MLSLDNSFFFIRWFSIKYILTLRRPLIFLLGSLKLKWNLLEINHIAHFKIPLNEKFLEKLRLIKNIHQNKTSALK